ncbi:DsbA family oxidoreductase [Fluviibacterium sp. S390]|uniref:DsbA family oxidoreductase n=1 Tax=Fluviibacterium sp. S390 TaxID=3415139 RepID=UPI003C7AC56A
MTKLEIFSDPICPWCLIGKTRLDRALATQPDHPFQIAWYPFQLNPDMPAEGMDRRAYLEAKFGGRDGALRVYGQIAETAEAEGIEVDFAAIQRTPNTLNAHRLIHWAGIEGHQNAVVDALFAAYFQQGRDIGDIEVLGDIADAAGLDAAVVLKLLKSDVDVNVIREGDDAARKMGINAAPTFIVGGAHAVPGAQPTELWQKVISELTAAAN